MYPVPFPPSSQNPLGQAQLATELQEELFIKFAQFEEKCKEPERARAIYKYALDHIPKAQAQDVYKKFVAFEKQHGDREGIEVRTLSCCCSCCKDCGSSWIVKLHISTSIAQCCSTNLFFSNQLLSNPFICQQLLWCICVPSAQWLQVESYVWYLRM